MQDKAHIENAYHTRQFQYQLRGEQWHQADMEITGYWIEMRKLEG
jgi:hypothetical protein